MINLRDCLHASRRSVLLAVSPNSLVSVVNIFKQKCGPLKRVVYWPRSHMQRPSVLIETYSSESLRNSLIQMRTYPKVVLRENKFRFFLPPFRICSDPSFWPSSQTQPKDELRSIEHAVKSFPNLIEVQPTRLNSNKLKKNMLNHCSTINDQINVLLSSYRLNEADQISRFIFVTSLEEIICRLRPDSHVFPFGSLVNGTGSPVSDIDMLLKLGPDPAPDLQNINFDLRNKPSLFQNILLCDVSRRNRLLNHMRNFLKLLDPLGVQSAVIYPGRIQIIHIARHGLLGIGMDISKVGCDGHEDLYVVQESASWQRRLINHVPSIGKAAIVLKYLMRESQVTSDGPGLVFTSHKIITLFIHFLQVSGYAPPMKCFLSEDACHLEQIENNIMDSEVKLPHHLTLCGDIPPLDELIVQFFKYLPTLQTCNNIIDLLDGDLKPRTHTEGYIYNECNASRYSSATFGPANHFVYAPDPVRPDINITHHITELDWNHFLKLTHEMLQIMTDLNKPQYSGQLWGIPAMMNVKLDRDYAHFQNKPSIDLLRTEEQIANATAF